MATYHEICHALIEIEIQLSTNNSRIDDPTIF